MEDLYDDAGYGWDDQDKLSELSEDGTRFLVARNKMENASPSPTSDLPSKEMWSIR